MRFLGDDDVCRERGSGIAGVQIGVQPPRRQHCVPEHRTCGGIDVCDLAAVVQAVLVNGAEDDHFCT